MSIANAANEYDTLPGRLGRVPHPLVLPGRTAALARQSVA